MVGRDWQLLITHKAAGESVYNGGFTDRDATILAGLMECRDFLRRVRLSSIGYDEFDCPIDEIIEACEAVDRAIAGYVEYRLMYWAEGSADDES